MRERERVSRDKWEREEESGTRGHGEGRGVANSVAISGTVQVSAWEPSMCYRSWGHIRAGERSSVVSFIVKASRTRAEDEISISQTVFLLYSEYVARNVAATLWQGDLA